LAATGKKASAATESPLHSFCSWANCNDGSHPYYGQLIMDAAGNLYGTTQLGGKHGSGVVFQLSPAGNRWKETVLHHFCSHAGCTDGGQPYGGLAMDAAGNLYGTTFAGGKYDSGVAFELTRTDTGWKEKVLHHFCTRAGCTDGGKPYAGLIVDSAGNLYGTASTGGKYSAGVAFRLSPDELKWKHTVLHHFSYGADGIYSDGAQPLSPLVMDGAGNLYGTTSAGGEGSNRGTVYRLSPVGSGWNESVLHHFCTENFPVSCSDGSNPYAGLIIDDAGNLYGTVPNDGPHGAGGLVFQMSPTGTGYSFTPLHTFPSEVDWSDGREPAGLSMDASGNLFGTTTNGGDNNAGVVFRLSPGASGYTHTVLHSFCADCTDGANPYAGVVLDTAGNLYGTTRGGGTPLIEGYGGVVFKITP
jgi:uncharacterized repeat protein (TIGR03803 family)